MGNDKNKHANELLGLEYGNYCMFTKIKGNHTFHHIEKECDGGKATVENGAKIIGFLHQWLHIIENKDHELYELVNECLCLYKKCKKEGRLELLYQYDTEVVPEYKKILERRNKKW